MNSKEFLTEFGDDGETKRTIAATSGFRESWGQYVQIEAKKRESKFVRKCELV